MVTTTRGTNGKSAEVLESLNPTTGEILGTVPVAGADEVTAAVARARRAAETWGAMSTAARRDELVAFRRALAGRAEEMAELIHRENGKPRLDALLEVMTALGHIHHAAVRAEKALRSRKVSSGLMANFRSTISYHPLGVVERQPVGDIVFVDVRDVLHGLQSDLLGHHRLDLAEPDVGIQPAPGGLGAERLDPGGAGVVGGEGEETAVQVVHGLAGEVAVDGDAQELHAGVDVGVRLPDVAHGQLAARRRQHLHDTDGAARAPGGAPRSGGPRCR